MNVGICPANRNTHFITHNTTSAVESLLEKKKFAAHLMPWQCFNSGRR